MPWKSTCQRVLEQDTEHQNRCRSSIFGPCAHLRVIGSLLIFTKAVVTVLLYTVVFPVFICVLILFSSVHFFLSPPQHSWPVPQLEPSQIRLIVYQDCERRGRNVLFDSSTMKRGPEESPVPVSHAFASFTR